MKKILLLLAVLPLVTFAQDGTLIDPSNSQTRQASAALEVYSTNQGFLSPRVALTSTADATTVTGTEPNGLLVYNTATAGDVTPGFYYWTGSAWSRLLNGATNLSGSGTTNYLARWTPNGNTLGIGVTYDNGTNVGISSTTPGAKLDVNGGNVRSTTAGDAKFEFFGSSSDRGFVGWQASAPVGVHLLNRDNTPIYFGTTNAERMRIDAVGNVGINSTAPGAKLDVLSGDIRVATDNNALLLGSTAATQYALHNYTSNSLWVQNNGNTTSNVVIATAFDWDRQIAIQYTPGTTGAIAGDLVIGQINKNNANFTHGITRFLTNGTERMRIASNGNVGVGVTGPLAKFHVAGGGQILGTNGTSSNTRTLTILEDGDAQINFGSYPGAWTSALQIQNNDNTRYVWISPLDNASGGLPRLVTGGSDFAIYPQNVLASTFSSSGDVTTARYHFAQYFNSSDNTIGSGVTSIMAKAGDNYFRSANAAAVASFLGTSLAGNYIQNQVSSAQSGNYWITGEARTNDWFRNMNNNTGLYNQANGLHWYSEGNTYWGTTTTGAGGIIFRDGHLGAIKGYVYQNDGGSFGLLSPDGNWKVRVDNGAIELYNTTYSPFIYDRDNTGYYWDGNSTSRMYYGDFNYLHTQVNDSWFPYTGNNWNYFRGNTYAWNATWYDENNTGYFIDPASTSRFYNINTLPGFDGYYPSNNAIRMTPNFHYNTPNGYAFIVNWDNGSSGATQVLRTTGDNFYVYADGQTFCSNWFRPTGSSGLYFQSYGGGWHMTDGTWIRAYNSKPVLGTGGFAGYGNAIGTWYGIGANMMANYNNAGGAGIVISDDGGFGDYNDGWVQFRGSTGLNVITDNGSWDMIFGMCLTNGACTYDKRVATGSNAWGLIGASGNAWWQAWAYSFNNASQRELKKDITPVKGALGDLVMADLDKMTPYLYRYNEETDEWSEQNYAKYRTGLHMGLILDETPDYIQSQSYNGVDVYAVASLGVAAGKHNREEIKQIKESIGLNEQTMNIQDFGSQNLNGKEIYVSFTSDFASKLGNVVPVITVTSNDPSVTLSVIEKSATGFKVISSSAKNVSFDYIAMAKVKNTMVEPKQEIPAETMKRIRVDQSAKDKVIQYWKDEPKREAERLAMEQEKARALQEQRKKELALPDGFIGPDKTPVHDPKLNNVDELIKQHNEKLSKEKYEPAPPTNDTPAEDKRAAEDLKNYVQIPADAPIKESPPAEHTPENSPR